MNHKIKVLYIRWADATSPMEGWQTHEEVFNWIKTNNYWVDSIGFLLYEDKKFIVLADKKSTTTNGNDLIQYAGITKIPKTWILKRKLINIL